MDEHDITDFIWKGKLQGAGSPQHSRTRIIHVSWEDLEKNRILAMDEKSPVSDQFKLLRTRIFQQTRAKGWNTLQVTGFDSDEGKSLVAANLAISIARDTRQTTLLADLDLRKPTVHRLFGLGTNLPGIESYLLGDTPLEEILVSPGIDKLTLLPAYESSLDATELMGSPKMEAMVRELKERYEDRYILFDTPGINVCPDPLVIAEYVDALLLVARADSTTRDGVRAAVELVPKEKILGLVLNDAQEEDPSGYYRYRYGDQD